MLDASAAFAGKRERPKELGFIVPHDERTRPLLGQPPLTGLLGRFFTDFPLGRPEIWDMVLYKGHVLASDMTGGFYSLQLRRQPAAAVRRPQAAGLGLQPQALDDLRATRILLRGNASDRGCSADADDAQARGRAAQGERRRRAKSGTRCRFVSREGHAGPRAQLHDAACSSPRGHASSWRLRAARQRSRRARTR